MTKTILVTGGTGYVGVWVVKGLLENGHSIRLAVRDKTKTGKYNYLADLANSSPGNLEIYQADLLKQKSFDIAAEGCDAIVHLASPFILNVKDPQRELVDPALMGTVNVLNAANHSSTVKKVVLTSSVVAIYGDAVDMKNQRLDKFHEGHFNTSSRLDHQPYPYSKTVAERKAWEMAEAQSKWNLVVLNPSFVMGPSLSSNSQSGSLKFMSEMLSGKYKLGAADVHFSFVDVRDVAKAHIYCLENQAEGRHILAERTIDMLSFANIIRAQFGNRYKLPKSVNPKWMISLLGSFFGLSREYVRNNVGHIIALDNSKSLEKLDLNYIPLEQTVRDMVNQMEEKEA